MNVGIKKINKLWLDFIESNKKNYDLLFINYFLKLAELTTYDQGEVDFKMISAVHKKQMLLKKIDLEFGDFLKQKIGKNITIKFIWNPINKGSTITAPNFGDLIVGKFNESVVEILQKIWSGKNEWGFVFIYADVGLGKTTLLKKLIHPDLQKITPVKYIHANDFGADVYKLLSIKNNEEKAHEIEEWKNSFFSSKIILIDDIQNLTNRWKTQEFLFDILKGINDKNIELVITSDKQPADLVSFTDRLKSRFYSGLTLEIDHPSLESAIKIVKSKIKQHSKKTPLSFTAETINKIAQIYRKDIRQLEGVLKTIAFSSKLNKQKLITFENLESEFAWIKDKKISSVSIKKIKSVVSKFYDVSYNSLSSTSRTQKIVNAKYVAIYFSRKITNQNFLTIAKNFNAGNHATAINATKKITEKIIKDANFKKEINIIEKKIFE